jgi:hypothetical protein
MIRLRAALWFSALVERLDTIDSNRFWIAPRSARSLDTVASAASITAIADCAPELVLISTVLIVVEVVAI